MTAGDATAAENTGAAPQTARGRLVFFLFGLSFVHGLALNLMPVLFPALGETFHLSKSHQGLLQTAFTGGMIAALIVAGYLINYRGARVVAWGGVFVAGLGALLFGFATTYLLVLGSAMLIGMGIATLTAIYAAVITARFADVRQRMYMLTFAVLAGSATLSTSVIGALVARFGYPTVFIAFGIFIWAWLFLLMLAAGPALDSDIGRAHLTDERAPSAEEPPTRAAAEAAVPSRGLTFLLRFVAAGVLNRGALYLLGLLVILDTLAAGNLLAWAPTYFEETYRLSNIGLVLSASSLGVFAGRLLLAALPPRFISDRVLLAVCYAGSMAAFGLILLLHPGLYVSLALIALSGAFVSAQAPTVYSIASAKFGERAPAAIPLIDAMGNLGGLAGAPLLGLLADKTGDLGAVIWSIPLCGFALVALALLWELADRARTVSGPAIAAVQPVE